MVISFSVKQARDQLLEKGYVYTFRWHERKHIGKDWANSGRTTSKIADVNIELVGELRMLPGSLTPYVEGSGFSSLEEWYATCLRMNDLNWHGFLYKVHLIATKKEEVS